MGTTERTTDDGRRRSLAAKIKSKQKLRKKKKKVAFVFDRVFGRFFLLLFFTSVANRKTEATSTVQRRRRRRKRRKEKRWRGCRASEGRCNRSASNGTQGRSVDQAPPVAPPPPPKKKNRRRRQIRATGPRWSRPSRGPSAVLNLSPQRLGRETTSDWFHRSIRRPIKDQETRSKLVRPSAAFQRVGTVSFIENNKLEHQVERRDRILWPGIEFHSITNQKPIEPFQCGQIHVKTGSILTDSILPKFCWISTQS